MTQTTLIIHPEATALSDITLNDVASTASLSGYVLGKESLRLGEHERKEIKYSEGAKRDGGEVISDRGPLVDLSFDIVISDMTLTGMLTKAEALELCIVDAEGGTLEYKPEGGLRSQFFAYLQSPPPALKAARGNRWDAVSVDGIFRVQLEVTLRTMPFASSDPDSLVTVKTTTTIKNTDDATRDNYITIAATDVIGSEPAPARILVTPKTSDLGRLIISRRTEGLGTFQATYNTAAYLSPTSGWSSVNDAARSGGTYYKCLPSANDVPYGLQYTISNWEDHKGTAAIAVVYKAFGENPVDDWEINAAWSIANTVFTGEAKAIQVVGGWRILILPEIDIPETEMSSLEDLDLYIDIYVTRTAGSGSIGIDAIQLVFTDEAVIEATAPGNVGATTSQDVLVENLDEELAHIITHSNQKLQYIMNTVGTPGLIALKPGTINRLDLLWERSAPGLADDMTGYAASWKKIGSFESIETWTGLHTKFYAIRWRAPNAATKYPMEITDGAGLNTAALVAAGKMQADGDDLRLVVDGDEVDRFLDGMNGAATKIWTYMDFVANVAMTLDGDHSATASTITVNEAITDVGATGILQIGTELIYYGTKTDGTKTFSDLIRGYHGTTAAAHNSAVAVYWIQHDILLVYGDALGTATAPTINNNYEPAFELDLSTNTSWVYEEFGENDGLRTGQWTQEESAALYGICYTGNQINEQNPWIEIGVYCENLSVDDDRYARFYLLNPCGITAVNFSNGEKIYVTGWEIARVVSSIDGVSWTTEYDIPIPSAPSSWQAWSYNAAITGGSFYVALYEELSAGNIYAMAAEAADVTLTLNSALTPTTSLVGTERYLTDEHGTYVVEGDVTLPALAMENMVGFYVQGGEFSFPFATTAYICFYLHMTTGVGCTAQSFSIYLVTDNNNYYARTWNYTEAASGNYDKYEQLLLSSFAVVGSPNLSDITMVQVYVSANAFCQCYVDDLRIVDADPGDAGAPNDTGVVWDFEAGTWHIYELDGSTKYLGQILTTAATEMIAMIHTDYGGEIQYNARCMAKREEGQVGLVFRCSDSTPGSEDGYMLLLDTSANQLLLKEYVAGSASNVADPVSYTFDVDGEYYLGIIARGSNIECFVSTDQATLWQVGNRKFNLTDTTYATGQCGVISIGTIGRFTDIDLDSVGDIHVPDDQVDVTVYALYRTIYPFTD